MFVEDDGWAETLRHLARAFSPAAASPSTRETAGFAIEAVYGGWSREPVGAGDGELIGSRG